MREIDKDFYCSAECHKEGKCVITGLACEYICENYHRKHPTPEQYEKEYGEIYPDNGAVYGYNNGIGGWMVFDFFDAKRYSNIDPIVCACTPWGKPANDWRPK